MSVNSWVHSSRFETFEHLSHKEGWACSLCRFSGRLSIKLKANLIVQSQGDIFHPNIVVGTKYAINSVMMHQVYKTLPDDRPITNISVVEDPDKCPQGYVVVHRTLDQDSDADLWREASFFGRKVTRYVCLSKTEGTGDYVVESVAVVSEKEGAPDGYCLLMRTVDSEQKAWRKRQLCYRLSRRTVARCVVTDIIVLSRLKKAPEGFSLAGEINGMTVCYKTQPSQELTNQKPVTPLLYSLAPQPLVESESARTPILQPHSHAIPPLSKLPSNGTGMDGEREQAGSRRPSRPAPRPPESFPGSYATIVSYQELDGVPFVLNPNFQHRALDLSIPVIKAKTQYQINKEYDYDFLTERQT